MLIEPPKKSNKSFLIVLFLIAAGTASFFLFIGDISLFSSGPASFTVQNFWGKAQISSGGKAWTTPERAKQLQLGDRIQTGPDAGIDLKFKGTKIRIKENSEVRIQAPKNGTDRVQLKKGLLLVSSNTPLQISIPRRFENAEFLSRLIVRASRGIFSVGFDRDKGSPWVQVLTGKVHAGTGMGKMVVVTELQKAQAQSTTQLQVGTLSQSEWKGMSEAYELISKSAKDEAQQMDLSKKAGNLFDSVFDHGTFYDPKSGFCERDFMQDPATGQTFLEVRYDVFPREALVGVYLKTRNFDAQKYQALKFDMRRVPEAGYPDKFLLELKYKGQVIRRYAAKMVRQDWTTADFPMHFNKQVMVDEITITFANDTVGPLKKGSLHLKDFTVEVKPAEPVEEAAEPAAPAPAAQPAAKAAEPEAAPVKTPPTSTEGSLEFYSVEKKPASPPAR